MELDKNLSGNPADGQMMKTFQCSICLEHYVSIDYLRRHVSKMHNAKENLSDDSSTLTESQPIQPAEPCRQRERVCEICHFKTSFADKYDLHRKAPEHLEKKRFRKMQKKCFTRRVLQRFKKLAGLRFRQYRCLKCEIKSMHKSVIVFHRNYRHKIMKPFKCSFCTMSFYLSRELEKHLVKVHTALKLKKCFADNCKRTFISNDVYAKHLNCVHKTKVSIKENDIKEKDDDDICEVEVINLVNIGSTAPFVIYRSSTEERTCRFCKVTCFNEVALMNHLLRHRQILTAKAMRTT